MSRYETAMAWLDTYRDRAFDILRVYLGIGLFVRGVLFLVYPSSYTELLPPNAAAWMTAPGVMYAIAFSHLIGGALIAIGLWTRLAALVQIPILFGAVFLVHYQGGLFSASQSFEFSALVLFLLLLLVVYGSEHWSAGERWNLRIAAFDRLTRWGDAHRDVAFDLLRAYIGVGLFVRGAVYVADSSSFFALIPGSSGAWLTSMILLHFVALIHVAGGVLLAVGLLTRIAALMQLPILLGAVFLAQLEGGLLTTSQSLEFSVLVLFLLVLIFLYGSGRWSADHYFFEQMAEAETEALSLRASEVLREARQVAPPMPGPHPEGLSQGGVAVATRPAVRTQIATCTCGHNRHHPQVEADVHYGLAGAMHFLLGITGPPKEIVFRCKTCGNVVEVSRDPEDLLYYRYRS